MFYILSKILPLLIYPTGLACILLILALVLHHRPDLAMSRLRRRDVEDADPDATGARPSAGARQAAGARPSAGAWPPRLIVAALLLIAVGGNRWVGMLLVRRLEWQHPPLEASALDGAFDAIVVLGGGTRTQLAPRPWHEVGEAGDRVIYAARLYRAGVAPWVLVSGGSGSLSNPGDTPESSTMAEMLTFFGVPEEAILIEGSSRNTYENAVESGKLLAQHGLERIVLVTSAMHMPRALGVFQQTALTVIPAPTDYLVTYSDWDFYTQPDLTLRLMHLLPKAEYLEMTEKALKEMIGWAAYRWQGWL